VSIPRLNPEQERAVLHGEGPLLVLAGAGSGKTRVLTARVARLIEEEGIRPERILAVTFTNKAAGVMRDRVADHLGEAPRGLWIGTFHSISARILRREGHRLPRGANFTIYDQDDSLRALKRAMEEVDLDTQRWSPNALRSRISAAKNALVSAEEYSATAFDLMSKAVAKAYPVYDRVLARSNAYDFDDLLYHAALLLEGQPEVGERYASQFRHVLVDEYQDTNHAQYRMILRLAAGHGNVCVVGDDDQSIYGWRGADLRNILDFERDFPGTETVRLERNYRSTTAILNVANEVISRNRARKAKRLFTDRTGGDAVVVVAVPDERSEASWVVDRVRSHDAARLYRPEDHAVLYRTNAQSRPFEDALRRSGVPYRIVGGVRFYERREIKDVLAYLQLAVNENDEAAFGRAVSWPRRGVGGKSLDHLREAARDRGESLLTASENAGEIDQLTPSARRALTDFAAGIGALREMSGAAPVEEVLRECVRSFGVVEALEKEEDGADRIANVTELLAASAAFDPEEVEDAAESATDLELFLQSAALHSDLDEYRDDEAAVTMMTLHNAKGLEFPVVFLAGLEDGLFPLSRAMESEDELEEERRLFYVGVTRAMDRLYITHASRRWRYGNENWSAPSPFLEEIPGDSVEEIVIRAGRRGYGGSGSRRTRSRGSGSGQTPPPGGRPDSPIETTPSGYEWRRSVHPVEKAQSSDGPRYDYSDSQVPLDLTNGARVIHPRFGEGEIVSLAGAGRSMKAEIEFDGFGRKKVMVAHAGLRPA
jgi:DNA helicase-2/ATP-dependent DNA helicase PcrA